MLSLKVQGHNSWSGGRRLSCTVQYVTLVFFLLLCLAKSGGDVQPDGGHITGAQPYQGTHGT